MSKELTRPTVICRTRCATAVAAVVSMFAAHGALAQETAPAATSTPEAAQSTSQAASGDGAQQPVAAVVYVAGTRKSVASAIDRKLRASTVSDSIVAEDIGQFPDKNVGEALSRVTGVQLTRDFGEGSQVAIRGVEPNLNRIEINGMSVLGTNGTAGRGAELRELASELIGSIDVYKGITADMTEGGVGGTVSIGTRKPLEFKKPTISTTLSGEQASSRGGVQPRGNLFMADRYLDGKLGVMANIVYDKVFTRNDYARNTSWRFLQDWDNSPEKTVTSTDPAVAAITSKAACATAANLTSAQRTACTNQWNDYSPGIARYGIWTRDHKRSSAELTAQYEVSKDFTVWASYQANKQAQRLNDRNFGTDFANANRLADTGTAPVYGANGVPTTAGTCVTPSGTPSSMVVENHYVTSYTVGQCLNAAGQGGQGAFSTSARDFALDIDSKYASTGFNYKRDRLEIEGLFNTSKSMYDINTNSIVLTQNAPGLKVSLDKQGLPHFTFPAAYSPDNPNSYVQAQLQYRPEETKNREDQAKLDFKYRLTTPFFTKVWFGAQARKTTSTQYKGGGYLASGGNGNDINVMTANVNQTWIYDPLYTGGAQRPNDTQTFINSNFTTKYVTAAQMASLVSAASGRSPGTFFNGYKGVSNMPASWMTPVYAAAAPNFDTSHFNHDYLYNAPGSDGKVYPQIPTFDVGERIASSYLRLDYATQVFGFDLDGNVGLRYTRTSDKAAGLYKYQVRTEKSPGSSSYTDVVVSNSVATVENTYHDYLPSFNGALWFTDRALVRLGWAKALARPPIDLLAPNATCTKNSGLPQFGGNGVDDCSAGNPDLKPYRSSNTDLSFEYYPSQDSQLSVAFFKKDISSYVMDKTLVRNVDLFHNGQLFNVTQPINGKGATTKGVELAARSAFTWLPGWLSGFGGDANYTRMGYKYAPGTERLNILDGTVLPYPGMSRDSYNLSLWYDRGPINARVAYNWRDRFFTGGNDVSGNPVFQEKTGFLDAKIQWRYNDYITFSLEGKNLTNQAQITDAGDLFRVNELAWSGRRYFFTVQLKN